MIKPSDENSNYITVMKGKSLTTEEIYKYGRNKDGEIFVNTFAVNPNDPEKIVPTGSDGGGGVSYYNSSECTTDYYWHVSAFDETDTIVSGCDNNYEISDVKKVLDNWSKDKIRDEDLIEVQGYKYRILTKDDLKLLPWYTEECLYGCA